jgi:hypothetical protein
MDPEHLQPDTLPDPWLFDGEALLRHLDRCRELTNQIPITDPNSTHLGIQIAVNAIWNLSETVRYLLHLHRDQQRAIRRQHEHELDKALSRPGTKNTIVHLHSATDRTRKASLERKPSQSDDHRRRKAFSHARGVRRSQVA